MRTVALASSKPSIATLPVALGAKPGAPIKKFLREHVFCREFPDLATVLVRQSQTNPLTWPRINLHRESP
jgi:hypothetical protein